MEEKNLKEKSEAALREERILDFWKKNKIFEKSVSRSEGKKEFVFYEGPPTANGAPGIHHLEARAFKDAIPRYKTMRGFHVRRKGGWDTHGLPVELQVEKRLGLNSKKAIEEYGIAKFNRECKESVWEYLDIWNRFTRRIGFWVDQENPYVTYKNDYIESVWSIVKRVDGQGLLYKDYKVVPWCPRCGTALSSHELAQGYETVKDLSVYVKFRLKSGQKYGEGRETKDSAYILAWTTTPWTLPGNVALAVGGDIRYTAVRVKGIPELLILASDRVGSLFKDQEFEVVHDDIVGKELVGLEYEPLYPYLKEQLEEKKEPTGKMFQVYAADFVNTEDGTGIVHTAVMYGQDDFELGTSIGLPKHHLVGLDGTFLQGTGFLEKKFVKDENTAVEIIKDVAHRGLLFAKEKYEHSYPHCWRCKTPLIYYARDSWYIRMSDPKVKGGLIKENRGVNWEPAHIRDGRFGEWLREIKDWAISRERYWGTPLPIWHCESCNAREVIGSLADLKAKTKKSGNTYFVMRHGKTPANGANAVSFRDEKNDSLAPEGKEEVKYSAEKLAPEGIDLIVASPFTRTRETAKIVQERLGLDDSKVIFDQRIAELNAGDCKLWREYYECISGFGAEWFTHDVPGGESRRAMYRRMGDFLYELEEKYAGKKILIISHGDPLMALSMIARGYTEDELRDKERNFVYLKPGEFGVLDFVPLSHNENYELDVHRPYIDDVPLACSCGGKLARTKEVMDVWFDSGAMPFAQDHYPFENKEWLEGPGFPADFISEAIDQTRGWFYTLHAIGVLMGRGKAFRNVICLGHLMDAKGKKMSKSLGNIVDPWQMIEKYGVDTLRLWMYSVNQPGESKNFDEKTVALLHGQVFGLLYNVLFFYELYRDTALESNVRPKSQNVLDIWILGKLDELGESMTGHMDNYRLLEPVRAIRDFVGDLSTWYVRRSRERVKESDRSAKQTLYFVLKTLSKLLAPFAPFAAEDIWQRLRLDADPESVHLERWPVRDALGKIRFVFEKGKVKKVLLDMETVRNIVSQGLKERQMRNLPVKQPLKKITLKIRLPGNFRAIVQEELNIKNVEEDANLESDLALDTELTPELRQEGQYREFVRALQDLRKKIGLTPSDTVALIIDTNTAGKELVRKFEADLKKTVLVSDITFSSNDGEELKAGDIDFRVRISRQHGM